MLKKKREINCKTYRKNVHLCKITPLKEISITDLRGNLKEVMDHVKQGKIIKIKQRGKVIATLNPSVDDTDELAFQARLETYKNGGIQIKDDIVDKPVKNYDVVDDSFYSSSIAAEPDA